MSNNYLKKFSTSLAIRGNTNQTYTEIPFCASPNGNYQENKQQIMVRMQEKGTVTHYWWESNLCNLFGNQHGGS
jgi:hypothetical protein